METTNNYQNMLIKNLSFQTCMCQNTVSSGLAHKSQAITAEPGTATPKTHESWHRNHRRTQHWEAGNLQHNTDITNSPKPQHRAQQKASVSALRQHDTADLNLKSLQGLSNASYFLPSQQRPHSSHGHRQTHHCESQRGGGRSSAIARRAVIQWSIWLLKHLVKLLWPVSGGSCQIHFQFLI